MKTGRSYAWTRRAGFPLLALLLHGLAGIALVMLPVRRVVTPPSPSANDAPFDVSVAEIVVDGRLAPEPPAPAPPRTAPNETAGPIAALGRSASSGDAHARPQTAEVVERPSPTAASPAGADAKDRTPEQGAFSDPVALVVPQTVDIGIGGTNRFLARSAEAVERAETQRAVDRTLRDAAREREAALGLGPEGPVLSALADATSRSVAPVRGRAVFVATSDASGEVVSIELHDAEGGRPGWADAARIALAGLRGKKLRVAPGTTRAVMKIEVVSAWKLPSGQEPGADVTLFHIPVAKGEGKDSPKVSVLDPIPKLRVDYYEPSPGVKIPLVSVQLDIFNTNADPSNLGAKPRRVIHSRLLDSKLM
jgi:hypothetical protein